ncbi:unnamed protein product [Rotaria sp. Silwood2]|nr:unnamed protein product [Rotaria sp. Silwood2]
MSDDVSIQLNPPITYPFLITHFDGVCYYGVALTFFKQFNNDDGTCSESSSTTAIITLNQLLYYMTIEQGILGLPFETHFYNILYKLYIPSSSLSHSVLKFNVGERQLTVRQPSIVVRF